MHSDDPLFTWKRRQVVIAIVRRQNARAICVQQSQLQREPGDYLRVAQRHRSCLGEANALPQAGVAVADRRHPVPSFCGDECGTVVWFNGHRLGEIPGAFRRGEFDITDLLRPGTNALAVRVTPPPHPGIPAEQSLKDGPGYDGGLMLISWSLLSAM